MMNAFRLLAAGLLVLSGSTWAQTYPDKSRPIRIIVPFGAGSSGDILARALGRGMSEIAGVNVIVDNKPGAESVIGVQAAKNSLPDGYTMLLTNSSAQVLNVHMLPNIPYDPVADFTPLVSISKFSLVLNTGPSLPFKTVREFIEAARANPGKYSYASATTSTRLAMELFERQANVKLLAVPYKSMAEATTALVAGQVDLLMNDVATVVPHYQSGRLRPLATTGLARMYALPNVPTLREEGLASYELTGWHAVYFPSKTPPAVSAAMRDLLRKAVKTNFVADAIALASFEPLDLSVEQLTTLQRTESERWGKLVRAMGGASK
jgi:tripartite-type tricarboxylate transporter receptor subunit TctC